MDSAAYLGLAIWGGLLLWVAYVTMTEDDDDDGDF